MSELENRHLCCISAPGELRCCCFCLHVFNSFSSSFLVCTIDGEEEERCLAVYCLRQCNLFINILERDAECGGGNVGGWFRVTLEL